MHYNASRRRQGDASLYLPIAEIAGGYYGAASVSYGTSTGTAAVRRLGAGQRPLLPAAAAAAAVPAPTAVQLAAAADAVLGATTAARADIIC